MPGRPAECLVRLPRAAYATRRLTVRMCPGLRARATDRASGRRAAQRRLSRDRSPAPANRRLRYMHMCAWASPGRATDSGEMPSLKRRDITCRCSTGQGSESPRALNVTRMAPRGSGFSVGLLATRCRRRPGFAPYSSSGSSSAARTGDLARSERLRRRTAR